MLTLQLSIKKTVMTSSQGIDTRKCSDATVKVIKNFENPSFARAGTFRHCKNDSARQFLF
jgi:hypothetical protein